MTAKQQDIIRKPGLAPVSEVWREIERKIEFLVEYVRSSGSESRPGHNRRAPAGGA